MKCIHCGEDSQKKDRPDGRCRACKHPFAFDPSGADPFSDAAFQHAIDVVSAQGTVRFVPEHVRWQLEKQGAKRPGVNPLLLATLIQIVVVALAGCAALATDDLVIVIVVGAALTLFNVVVNLALWQARRFPRGPGIAFGSWWQRWISVHGKPKGLIEPPRRRELPPMAAELEGYSFDRAVICDRPELVDVLVANRFHFENNCAILGIGGYPEHAFELVRKMLRNNPKLLVLAVHDCAPAGCRMAHQLRTNPAWFVGQRVVDVGLRPAHARFFPGQVERVEEVAVRAGEGIYADEVAFLRRHRISAMAIRPEQLVKRLYKAIVDAESGRLREGDDGVAILSSDSGTVDGGADSFG